MIGMTRSRVKYLLAAAAVLWLLALPACVPQFAGHDVGLDAISPDSHWATLVEYSGDPPTPQLVRLDLQSGETMTLVRDIDPRPKSSFSPSDSDYVLFHTQEGWYLDIAASQPYTVPAKSRDQVQFLPDGELLVIDLYDDLTDDLTRFRVFDPPDSASPSKSENLICYWFSNQRRDLHVGEERKSVGAAGFSAPDTMRWVMVKQDYAVSMLIAGPDGISVESLRPDQSTGVKETLRRQEAMAQRAVVTDLLTEEIKQQATDAGEDLSDEELAYRVKERLEILSDAEIALRAKDEFGDDLSWVVSLILSGILSPDGGKLLVLCQDQDSQYSLFLVDLDTGAGTIELSDDTAWVPSFGFSPDGRHILYEANGEQGRSLYLANSDGSHSRLVEPGALRPRWH
jgi:dipeptidyl aminopeptidase/acylaminoacyl peptidase